MVNFFMLVVSLWMLVMALLLPLHLPKTTAPPRTVGDVLVGLWVVTLVLNLVFIVTMIVRGMTGTWNY